MKRSSFLEQNEVFYCLFGIHSFGTHGRFVLWLFRSQPPDGVARVQTLSDDQNPAKQMSIFTYDK